MTLTTHPLASAATVVSGVATYPNGNIWFAATDPAEIGVFNPSTAFSEEFPLGLANSTPQGIAVGKDGMIYFTDPGTNSLGVFNPITRRDVEVPVPTPGSDPTSIAVANDGTVWFTETAADRIGMYDPKIKTKTIVEYPLPGGTNISLNDITLGPDGNLWFERSPGFQSINPTTRAIASVAVDPNKLDFPDGGFSFTADGNIWYETVASFNNDHTGRFSAVRLTTSGVLTVFPPSSDYTGFGPYPGQTAVGADGNVYVAQTAATGTGTTVAEIAVATGTISTYLSGDSVLEGSIVAGTDGNLYLGGLGVIARATIVPATQSAVSGQVTYSANPAGSGVPLPGRIVFVDLNREGTIGPNDPFAVTDANGNYTIAGVPIGSFNVRVAPGPGDFTTPAPVTTTGGNASQNVDLAVRPSFILPLTLPADPFGVNNPDIYTAEVNGLYRIVLDRAPDASGLAAYSSYLRAGGSLGIATEEMLHSREYETDLVGAYYQNFFGRTATPGEVGGWVALMQNGYTAEQITTLMLSSGAFNALYPDNISFIQAVYGDVLGRPAGFGEIPGWQSYLATSSRASAVNLIVHSTEAYRRAAGVFYAAFWASPPDPTGVGNVVSALASGLTQADVASFFAASPAYVGRAAATVG